jgi:hypothetical protein
VLACTGANPCCDQAYANAMLQLLLLQQIVLAKPLPASASNGFSALNTSSLQAHMGACDGTDRQARFITQSCDRAMSCAAAAETRRSMLSSCAAQVPHFSATPANLMPSAMMTDGAKHRLPVFQNISCWQ